MNELSLVINQNPGSIELNFDALEEQLDKKLSEYKGAVFTEDTKTIAKAHFCWKLELNSYAIWQMELLITCH